MRRLVVFDIDGTLTDTNNVDDECFLAAVGEALHVDPNVLDWSNAPHVTDSALLRWLAERYGQSALTARQEAAVVDRFVELLEHQLREAPHRFRPIAGAPAACDALADRGWYVAFATGAWERSPVRQRRSRGERRRRRMGCSNRRDPRLPVRRGRDRRRRSTPSTGRRDHDHRRSLRHRAALLVPRVRVGAQVSDADDANEPVATMINVLAALAIFAQDTVSYDKPETWLCRPGRQDACAIDLTTSVIAADGHLTTESWRADAKAPIDCFYVYPTVSLDTTDHSDMNAGEEERNAVRQQFARFGSVCRPYAPIYRQVSLRGLRVLMATPGAAPEAMVHAPGYHDVLAAWRYYLAHDNGGRGVVLIGHSQGATVLKQLIRQEIDGKPVQSRIVSAILVGNAVAVPVGRDVGGTFESMPLCRKSSQTGCIITYASFRNTVPPSANALFGRVPGDGMMAACTNPAALGGGSGQLHAYLTGVGTLVTTTAMPRHRWTADGASIGTPFVSVPGLLTAQCVADSLGSRLEVTVHADTTDGRADDVPGDIGVGTPAQARWGLHLIDVNLAMGNLLDIVRRQSAAFRR